MRKALRIGGLVLAGIVLVAILVVFGGIFLLDRLGLLPQEHPADVQAIAQFDSIAVGMPEAQVLSKLGRPGVVYGPGTPPDEYRVSGYRYERRPVVGKLLIFWGGADVLAYVYLDKAGKVEHVYVCQS